MIEDLYKNNIWALRLVIEESPIPTALYTGHEMQVSLANTAWLNLWGKDEAILGKTLQAVLPELAGQPMMEQLHRAFKDAETYEAKEDPVYILINGKLNRFFFNCSFKPLKNESGELWGILHTATDVSELVLARSLADKAESRIQFTLQSAAMGSWDIDLANKTVWWDEKCRELFGNLRGNQGSYNDILDCIDPLDTERFNKALTLISGIAPEKAYSITIRTKRTNNNPTRWLECKGRAYYNEDGIVNRFAGIVHDITAQTLLNKEQQIGQEKLILSELRFRHTIEQAPAAIGILKGQDLIIEEANIELLKLWGKRSSVIGTSILEALPEIADQGFIELLLDVYETGQPYFGYETSAILERNGILEKSYFNFVYAPVRDIGTAISGVVIVATDVTEQVESKLQLQRSEKRFLDLILEAPIPTALYTGEDLIIELANDAMLSLWGKDKQVIGMKLSDAVPELTKQPFMQFLNTVYRSGQTYHTEQQSIDLFIDNELKIYWFNYTFKPLLNHQGAVNSILHTAIDISAQVQLQKQKDDFLGVASHELKTPVTSIKAYVQLLEQMLLQGEHTEQAGMVAKIDQQITRLTHLINDLLDVTKFQSGSQLFNDNFFAFNELVIEMVEELQWTSNSHTIRVSLEGEPFIYADKERLGQVITNLVTNAIKYSPGKEEVLVRSAMKENELVFSVQDFGIGIPDDKKEKVFEQFYRVSGSLQRTFPGLGLGLYISAEIVKRAGGHMWVNSKTGEGSTFSFCIPFDRRKQSEKLIHV